MSEPSQGRVGGRVKEGQGEVKEGRGEVKEG